MPNGRHYIDTDVLTEAKKRYHRIFDLYDEVVVTFSGGKDSLVCLELAWEVAQERGLTQVNALFRDEELIPDAVLDFVKSYADKPWVNLKWLAVPLRSQKFILGELEEYIQWDPNREWRREKPPWAITNADIGVGEQFIWDQYSTDDLTASPYKGKVAIVTGVRAAESLMRYRAVLSKLNDSYMAASGCKRASMCKPIFDWQENDVFRYFYDRDLRYCPQYDNQLFAGQQLRVATPLIAESAKHFDKLRAVSPVLYDQVMDIFPEMAVQERYWHDMDKDLGVDEYGGDMLGVKRWIDDNITDPVMHAKALVRFAEVAISHQKTPLQYPVLAAFRYFKSGGWKRSPLLPKGNGRKHERPNR